MKTQTNLTRSPLRLLALLFLFLALLLVACNPAANNGGVEPAASNETENMDHDNDADHEHDGDAEHEHEEDAEHEHDETERIDNAGAVIQIVSPAGGSTFGHDEDVIVEVEVTGFVLGEDDNHWHIYVDGASWGMITGGDTAQVLRGVDPGEHEITVFLAGGDHIELAEGDAIMITVTE